MCHCGYSIIALSVAKLTHQIGHYTKEKGLEDKLLEQIILQLARDAGDSGFKLSDVYVAFVNALLVCH